MTLNDFVKCIKSMKIDTTLKFGELKRFFKVCGYNDPVDQKTISKWIDTLRNKNQTFCYVSKDAILRKDESVKQLDNPRSDKEVKEHLTIILDAVINKNIDKKVDEKIDEKLDNNVLSTILESLVSREFKEEVKPALIKSLNDLVESKTTLIHEKLERQFTQQITDIKNKFRKMSNILEGKE